MRNTCDHSYQRNLRTEFVVVYLSKSFQAQLTSTQENAQRGRVSFDIDFIQVTMNSFADRFSTTSAASYIKQAQTLAADDEEFSDAAWGSEAGFGSLAKGVPNFSVPAVPDVSCISIPSPLCLIIFSLPLSCDFTQTTTQIPIAESRSSMERQH